MPRIIPLSWNNVLSRWRKHYKGKEYHSKKCSKSDRAAYRIALAECEEFKRKRDEELAAESEAKQVEKVTSVFHSRINAQIKNLQKLADAVGGRISVDNETGEETVGPVTKNHQLYDRMQSTLATYEANKSSQCAPANAAIASQPPLVEPFAVELIKQRLNSGTIDQSRTLSACHKDWIKAKSDEAKQHGVSSKRVTMLEYQVRIFIDYYGDRMTDSITGDDLAAYRSHLISKHSTNTARDYFQALKQFLRWCHGRERLDKLPRNFNSEELAMSSEISEIKVWSKEDWRLAMSVANDRNKLYLLLMLNCGMTQKDISDLKDNEVDWKAGSIIRRRSKTRRHKKPPMVCYKLWPETFRLLNKFRTSGPTVLLSEEGCPLVGEKKDGLGQNWDRLCKAKKIEVPSLKYLRKTGASAMEKLHGPNFSLLYLANSPEGIAARHYVKPDQDKFDAALASLGAEYGLL